MPISMKMMIAQMSDYGRPRREQVIQLAAIVALALVYALDVFTPADLSVGVAYQIPPAIVGLGVGSSRAFLRITIFAAILSVAGYLGDALTGPFDVIEFQNRIISLASLTLVYTLMMIVHRSAARAALAQALEARNSELLEHQQLVEELVAAIAHDVRTPLAALSLTLKQAVRGQYGPLPETYRDVAIESRTSIDDISRLADTLLAVARFEAGAALPETEPVALSPIGRALAAEFQLLMDARQLTFVQDVDERAVVLANPADVRRALGNLVANAARHTLPGGTIVLSATHSTLGWRIDVRDDGVGVSDDARPTLFERFTPSGDGGTGLGLHIVKRIAECFGGSATFAPCQPRGSCFSLDLPKAS